MPPVEGAVSAVHCPVSAVPGAVSAVQSAVLQLCLLYNKRG